MRKRLTTKEAAAHTGLSEQTIRAKIKSGEIPAERFGERSHAIRLSDLKNIRRRKAGRPKKKAPR